MAEKRNVKNGDDVQLVLASGRLCPAKVVKVNKDGTVNLEFMHNGQAAEITSSPLDETAKRPDCWCLPAVAEEPKA